MDEELEPIITFDKFKAALSRMGIHVGQAVPWKEITPEDVGLNDVRSGNMEIDETGIYVIDPEDGTRRRVYLYKRRYHLELYGKPRYHVCKCSTINSFLQSGNRIPDYRRANTGAVIVKNWDDNDHEVTVEDLPLCKYCKDILDARRSRINSLFPDSEMSEEERNILENMYGTPNSTAFSEILRNAAAAETPVPETHEVDSRGNTKDWREVSEAYMAEHDYTCEQCGVQVSDFDHEYIQVHHINGDRTNNKTANLKCLCVKCHSEVDQQHKKNFSSRSGQLLLRQFLNEYGEQRDIRI